MRTDSTLLGTPTTTIIDIEAQKFISVNHKKKEVTVYDMAQFRQDLDKSMKTGAVEGVAQAERPEEGHRRPRLHRLRHLDRDADGDGRPGRTEMTMVMTGPVFIAKGAPGSADYARFHHAAAEKGFVMSDPRAAKGNPSAGQGHDAAVQGDGRYRRHPLLHGDEREDRGRRPDGRDDEQDDGRGGIHPDGHGSLHRRRAPTTNSTLPADYKVKDSK